MGSDISESGWTMYLDQSIDSRSNKISSEFDTHEQYTEPAEKYPTCQYQASSIADNQEDCSMASVASSCPQNLSMPLQDIEFEKNQSAGSSSSVFKRKRDAYVNVGEHLECIASCTLEHVNPRKNKWRKLNKDEDKYEDTDMLLQDTASSLVCGLEEEEVNARLETLRSLLPDAAKIIREEILEVTIEYIRALKRRIQAMQIIAACSKYSMGCLRDCKEWPFQLPCYFLCEENATATATAAGGVHNHHIQSRIKVEPPTFTPSAYSCNL